MHHYPLITVASCPRDCDVATLIQTSKHVSLEITQWQLPLDKMHAVVTYLSLGLDTGLHQPCVRNDAPLIPSISIPGHELRVLHTFHASCFTRSYALAH